MKTTLSIILLYLVFPISVFSENIYCTGHDACKNKVWSGEYNIYCGASNSERTCKNTILNCGEGDDCLIKTQGSGHDAYQSSTVNAKTSASFKLYCQASGQRDCRSITVWCPQESGSTCECVSCPSTVTFKCVQGVSCSSVSNAHIDYVQSDTYSIPDSIWYKDTTHTGKRPDCPFSKATNVQNYVWATLPNCKTKCIEETTGKCNMVSRFGDSTKSPTEAYHCRFYECPDPNNFTWVTQEQWGNFASDCNTYMLPIRHYTFESRYINVTKTINITNYVDVQRLKYTPYQIKTPGTNTCPIGFSHIKNKNECLKAQQEVASDKSFQGIPHPEHPVSGCYLDTLHNRVYMPPASHGSGHTHMTPICKATCESITNKTIYHYINKTLHNYINKTIIDYLNLTIYNYKNITNFKEVVNYINRTIYNYKNITILTNITNVNHLINYVNETRYIDIPIYFNITRYQNISREIIHLINRYNYVNKTNIINITKVLTKIIWREKYNITNVKNITNIIKIKWKNKTRWNNKTSYKQVIVKVPLSDNDKQNPNNYNSYHTTNRPLYKNETCNCKEVHPMSFWVQIGFFITLGLSTFAALVCIWRCWLKEMIEDYIDDLFCCGYGEEIKNFCECICICCELCKNDESPEVEPDEELELPRMVPRLDENIPTARPVNKNLIIDTNANPIYRIEEGVTTPGGTQIRRRTVQV
tara:strand:+ start:172 stop:2271 length:2100 start_codon:yes stop_codon:yes gene_type:complete